MAVNLCNSKNLLLPALHDLQHGGHHPGIGSGDQFDIWFDNLADTIVGRYRNARLKMSETATIFEAWEVEADRGYVRYFRGRMLALVDKVYARVSVARLVDQARIDSCRPRPYRPGVKPAAKPRLVRSNPLLEKINVRVAA